MTEGSQPLQFFLEIFLLLQAFWLSQDLLTAFPLQAFWLSQDLLMAFPLHSFLLTWEALSQQLFLATCFCLQQAGFWARSGPALCANPATLRRAAQSKTVKILFMLSPLIPIVGENYIRKIYPIRKQVSRVFQIFPILPIIKPSLAETEWMFESDLPFR